MQTLKREITEIPPAFDGEFPFVSEWTVCYHDEKPDDEHLILERIKVYLYKGVLLYIPLIISFIFAVVISWLPVKIASFFLFAFILYRCIFGYKVRTSEQMVFNRLEGTVTYPVQHEGKIIEHTEPFDKAPFSVSNEPYHPAQKLYIGDSENPEENTLICSSEALRAWSLLVWYMDRNRPLLLGTVFDVYRERDYNRRQSEGFPLPLYTSTIPTGDYKPE